MAERIADEEEFAPSTNFLKELTIAECEITDIISHLVETREALRDEAVRELENETESLMRRLEHIKREAMLEELRCFKDILELHREGEDRRGKPLH